MAETETAGKEEGDRKAVTTGNTETNTPAPTPVGNTSPPPDVLKPAAGTVPPKKEFPKAGELKSPAGVEIPRDIPSTVSLADIPLPPSMKGAVPASLKKSVTQVEDAPDLVAESSTPPPHIETPLERSMREIGMTPPKDGALKIVSVKSEMRTEIDENGLPRIRTYATDMSQEIKKRGASLTTIVSQERERVAHEAVDREARESISGGSRSKIWLYLVGTLVFIIIGAGIIVAAMYFSTPEEAPIPYVSLIPVNSRANIPIEDTTNVVRTLSNLRKESQLPLGEVEEILLTKGGVPLAPADMLAKLGAPMALQRNATQVMVGFHAYNHIQPYVIVVVSTYDLSFNAMLQWEDRMAETLQGFFEPVGANSNPPPLEFTDQVYRNIDTRRSQSSWQVVYAFPDQKTLILTTNDSTLQELLTRLSISETR